MRFTARILVVGAAAAAVMALYAPIAQAAFGVAKFEAGTCKTDTPECSYEAPETQFYTEATGHPPLGLTGFEVNTKSSLLGKEPEGNVKDVRVDIPPGLSVNPQATCSKAELETETCAGKGQCTKEQFEASSCPSASLVGSDELDAFVGGVLEVEKLSLPMYNLVPPEGVPAEFGFELNVAKLVETKILIVGGLSWYKEAPTSEDSGVPTGDYHEYFTIKEVPNTVGLVKTRLKFTGTAGNGTFITLPSVCGTQTSYLHVDSYEHPGQFLGYSTVSGFPPKAISVSGCNEVPFVPSLSLGAGKSEAGSDQPDGVGLDVHVPQSTSAPARNSSDVKDVHVTFPEGLTMNPSAAHGLQACTEQEIGLGTNHEVGCPAASRLGSVSIETPMLPPKSLAGSLYLGSPSGAPISGPPFTVYLAAESHRYGVGIRLRGTAAPDPSTGQLTTTFSENPALPFEDVVVQLDGGPRAPLANPLVCAPAPLGDLTPYTGALAATPVLSSPFSPGLGSVCPSTAPFSLSQSVQSKVPNAGAYTPYTLNLARADGQQYLSRISTVLPPGLVGAIPSVALCGEPQAAQGTCSSASQIGTATVAVGAGPEPYTFAGPVFLTGPYGGAPYGMSIAIPAVAGPFDFGTVVTRATVGVDPYTARVVVTSALPTIVKGVPLRLKSLSVAVDRQKFLFNPTNCGHLATNTTLTSTFGATQLLSTPFQATGCGALAFKPRFTVSTNARASRRNGASLTVKVGYPKGAQANISSVFVTLPKQLPSRLSTLKEACTQAVFAANPLSCPAASMVGEAIVTTPVLPGTLSGPAIFVSHGGAAFPDLDLVLRGSGVTVILVGNTNISGGVTTSDFAAIPDVPVSSFALKLPAGKYSALTAIGDLCIRPLYMPTIITAQNGGALRQNTRIAVFGCPVRIVSHRVRGRSLILTVQTYGAGRLSAGGRYLKTVSRRLRGASSRVTLRIGLSRAGLRALAGRRRLKVRVRVGFVGVAGAPRSSASVTALFR